MIAGGGSLFDQQFGLPVYLGSLVITVLTIATLFLNFKGILYVLGVFTPIMFILLVAMSGYSAVTTEYSFEQFMQLQQPESAATFHWLLGACLFVSNCVAASFPMLSVMGGSTKNKKSTVHRRDGRGFNTRLTNINDSHFDLLELPLSRKCGDADVNHRI
ncbi:membrane protein [Geomicrobium sp. JCM 19055]|nr:membrane protein [Geomicrobium sp. JCM 19055]